MFIISNNWSSTSGYHKLTFEILLLEYEFTNNSEIKTEIKELFGLNLANKNLTVTEYFIA